MQNKRFIRVHPERAQACCKRCLAIRGAPFGVNPCESVAKWPFSVAGFQVLGLHFFHRQLVAYRRSGRRHRSGRQFQDRMSQQARRKPPRRHRASHLPHLLPAAKIYQINGKFHEEGMYGFARNDPQTFACLQPLALQQARSPFGAGIRHLHRVRQNGPAGLVTHQYFQF